MQRRVALYTFGMFIQPAEHPANDGFHQRNDPILANVDGAAGFIARSGYDDDPGPEPWGEQAYPRFYQERGDGWSPATLSLWTDLESIVAFTYFGLHAEALRHGRNWFQTPQWPRYVTWWVDADHRPDWTEGAVRHEHLHDHGPTNLAFNFKHAFDAAGEKAILDREKIKALVDGRTGPR